jgi:hypothetical protein
MSRFLPRSATDRVNASIKAKQYSCRSYTCLVVDMQQLYGDRAKDDMVTETRRNQEERLFRRRSINWGLSCVWNSGRIQF